MPLHAPAAPPAALDAVMAALRTPPNTHTAGRVRRALLEGAPLTAEVALPVHALTGVRGGKPRTRMAGWRFLLRQNGHTVVTADAAPAADGWVFSHFAEGPYAASAERCLRLADALTGPYEPRLLSVPELYMMTLWLHGPGPAENTDTLADDDLLVPLSPAPPGIAPHQPRRADGLLPLLTHRLAPTSLIRTA